jgi:hypothetical protein
MHESPQTPKPLWENSPPKKEELGIKNQEFVTLRIPKDEYEKLTELVDIRP